MSEPLQQRARRALTRRLEELLADRLGGEPPGLERERVRFLADNLVPGLSAWQISVLSHQIARGDGGELDDSEGRPGLHCAWSSAGLVANCFGAWIGRAPELRLAGHSAFERFELERRCPIFKGGTPPNLDLVLWDDTAAIGVESKCTEHLGRRGPAKFSSAYDREDLDGLLDDAWRAVFHEQRTAARAGRIPYRHLDTAQLVKHALGLSRTFPDRDLILAYLYWEPRRAEQEDVLLEHRGEVQELSEQLAGARIAFLPMSYTHLWEAWEQAPQPVWLSGHVTELRERYDVAAA
jgi:hypothetical protein